MSGGKVGKKKSRLVLPENRRRAAFSCDRCKTKKVKCKRSGSDTEAVKFDNTTPCTNCQKLGLECITSIPRRRRVYSSYENLGMHYQCLLTLVQGLHPDIDTNDINELLKMGEEMGIKMPSGLPEDTLDQYEVESKILKPFSPKIEGSPNAVVLNPGGSVLGPNTHQSNNLKSNNASETRDTHGASSSPFPHHAHNQTSENYPTKDTLVIDSRGDRHYVGSSGTSVLFTVICDLLLKRSYRTNLSFDYKPKLFQNSVDGKSKEDIAELIQKEPNFPIVKFITKLESDYYVDLFFQHFHSFYFIFDEKDFRKEYERYWEILEGKSLRGEEDKRTISNPFIGCIYLVWLTCASNQKTSNLETRKIIEVLQIILPEVTLASSINSIQFLYLFARYLSTTKNRDSAWNLIGLAVRQSVSLGLHKKIMSSKKSEQSIILNNQILWSLYKMELSICAMFGRHSTINEDEIDVGYPDLASIPYLSDDFKQYYYADMKLSRFLNKILKERRSTQSQQPISLIKIERTLLMKNQLYQMYKDLEVTPIDEIQTIYEFKINLHFNYYMVLLTLPFIVYISITNYKVQSDETLLNIMKTGIHASIQTSKLLYTAVGKNFNQGAISMDCSYAYPSSLVSALFFIYLSNTSNDMLELEVEGVSVDKKKLLETISNVLYFMEKSSLDSTTKRIYEVLKGIKNDLKLVEIQDNLKFDVLNFDGSDQIFDSLMTNDDIYMNGFDIGMDF